MKINIDISESSRFDGQIRIMISNDTDGAVKYAYTRQEALDFINEVISNMTKKVVF